MSAENPGNLAAVKTLTLKGNGVLDLKVRLDSRSSRELACSWYMHPEYTVGGEAVSHSDLLTLPIGGKELEIPYWTGLGDRTTPEFSDGYWLLTSPSKHYRIRQDFSLDEFRQAAPLVRHRLLQLRNGEQQGSEARSGPKLDR